MSRFGTYCKRCRAFRENISSEEVKASMDRQQILCFAGMDCYENGECRFFLDIEEPLDTIVREVALESRKENPGGKTFGEDTTGAHNKI